MINFYILTKWLSHQQGQNAKASFGEISKIVASMWESLDPTTKEGYKQRTELAKKEYLRKLAAYRYGNRFMKKPVL